MSHHRLSDQIVARFWEFVGQGLSYSTAWEKVREWCEEEGRKRGLTDPTNSWRSASGQAFEVIAQNLVIEQVGKSDLTEHLVLYRWRDSPAWIRDGILSERVWPKDELREPETAYSNVDLICIAKDMAGDAARVLSVYSCKSSVAERYQQDLYWAERLRGRSIKFCFVTIDQGFVNYAIGSRNSSRDPKAITLGRALYDRIYLLTEDKIVNSPRVFKGIEEVVKDMDLWLQAD